MLDDRDILSYLNHDGERLAFHGLPGTDPGLFFLSGFRSDMTGSKAEFLAGLSRTQGVGYTRFDYSGHGASSGDIVKGDIDRWLSDALAIFDQVTTGKQILIGSSMGGWIALLLARARPERVAGFIGIAAAPDFTETLIWDRLPSDLRTLLHERGHIHLPTEYGNEPYVITAQMIESGRRNLLLQGPLEITCPVRLLHGMEDQDVPWHISVKLASVLHTANVRLTLVKDGEHRLSRDTDLSLLKDTVNELLHQIA